MPTQITALPTPAPARTQTQAEFDANYAAHIAALPTFVTEANALAGEMNATSGAGAIAIPYTFSTTTTDADPGNGILRLSAATQNTATVIRADLLGSDGTTYTGLLDIFDDSTNTVKGYIRLVHATDATKFLIFSVTSLASPAGYKNITVTNISSSAASPFANGDAIVLYFTRSGDSFQGVITLGTPVASTSGTTIDFTSIPAGAKRVNVLLSGVSTSGGSPLAIQIGDSGGIEATGYTSIGVNIAAAGVAVATSTTRFLLEETRDSSGMSVGKYTLELENSSTNTWIITGESNEVGSSKIKLSAGSKSLSAVLDRVRITTANGTDTFDAGEINVSYQ